MNYQILKLLKLPIPLLGGNALSDQTMTELFAQLSSGDWIVDALLGTGVKGNPRPPIDGVIRQINQVRQQSGCRLLALDLPSGLDTDAGQANDPTIQATETATFFAMKNGIDRPAAKEYLGTVHVLDIGIPQSPVMELLRFPAANDNAAGAFQSQSLHEVGNSTSSIFHENQPGHTELGYRQLIYVTRLLT